MLNMNKLNIDFTSNVYYQNSVYNFGNLPVYGGGEISALSLILERKFKDKAAQIENIKFLIEQIIFECNHYEIWLCISNKSWQPDTKFVRRKGFVNRFFSKNSDKTLLSFHEKIYESENGIKFIAELNLRTFPSLLAAKIMLSGENNYLVVFPKDEIKNPILNSPIFDNLTEDFIFFNGVFKANGIIFKNIGNFDDQEMGFIGFGASELCIKLKDFFRKFS